MKQGINSNDGAGWGNMKTAVYDCIWRLTIYSIINAYIYEYIDADM